MSSELGASAGKDNPFVAVSSGSAEAWRGGLSLLLSPSTATEGQVYSLSQWLSVLELQDGSLTLELQEETRKVSYAGKIRSV